MVLKIRLHGLKYKSVPVARPARRISFSARIDYQRKFKLDLFINLDFNILASYDISSKSF